MLTEHIGNFPLIITTDLYRYNMINMRQLIVSRSPASYKVLMMMYYHISIVVARSYRRKLLKVGIQVSFKVTFNRLTMNHPRIIGTQLM